MARGMVRTGYGIVGGESGSLENADMSSLFVQH